MVNIQGIKERHLSEHKDKGITPETGCKARLRRWLAGSWGKDRAALSGGQFEQCQLGGIPSRTGKPGIVFKFYLQRVFELDWGGPVSLVGDMNVQPRLRKTPGRGESTEKQ